MPKVIEGPPKVVQQIISRQDGHVAWPVYEHENAARDGQFIAFRNADGGLAKVFDIADYEVLEFPAARPLCLDCRTRYVDVRSVTRDPCRCAACGEAMARKPGAVQFRKS